jgi:TonB family protein
MAQTRQYSTDSGFGPEGAAGQARSVSAPARPTDRANRLVWGAAVLVVLMAHAAVLYAMTRDPNEALAGSGGQVIDAINVTMVATDVLESREPDRVTPAPASSAASVESTDGAPQSAAAAPAEQREERKEETEKKEKPKDEPVREADAVLEVPQDAQRQEKQETAAPATGGAASRTEKALDAKTSAPAAASPGAVREYSRYVAQALAKSKPKGAGALGTVRVRLMIAADGGLAGAEIAKSSGSPKLDELALGAARKTKFPVPPAGMTPLQLTYEVPYHFR